MCYNIYGDSMKKKALVIAIVVEIILITTTIVIYNPFLKLQLIGNAIVKISIGDKYVDKGVKASYLKEDLTKDVKISNNVDVNKIGEYKIVYTLKKGKSTREIVRTVIVADLISPEITLKGGETVSTCGKEYVEEGYTATDNVDGDLTKDVKVTKKDDSIIYSVVDKSGNKKEVVRKLIKDNVKPEMSLIYSDNLTVEQNTKYKEFGAKAIDNCDGDISSKIEIISNVDTSKHEVFTVTYKVKDSSNNEATITRKVKIYDQNDLNKGYTEIVSGPTYIKNILVINKKYSIPVSFKADDSEALKALENLKAAAKEAGHSLPTKSAYRSYYTQKSIYERYTRNYGQEYADRRSAKPGHSEHQTGLAFDVGVISIAFGSTPTGIWLKENCAKYGFIIRYPEYKQAITGYSYEPWHIRYLGVDVATEIMEKNITLEEYLGIYDIND